jgi:hypothetical protein
MVNFKAPIKNKEVAFLGENYNFSLVRSRLNDKVAARE